VFISHRYLCRQIKSENRIWGLANFGASAPSPPSHTRRPSFSGCRLTDLELTTRHSRFGINAAVVPAPIENFSISTILYLLAL